MATRRKRLGSHTFSLISAVYEGHWVKFHFTCQQDIENLTDAVSEALIGKGRESAVHPAD